MMANNIIKVKCASCGSEFIFAGTVEGVPDGVCLDCFVEKYGEEEVDEELQELANF